MELDLLSNTGVVPVGRKLFIPSVSQYYATKEVVLKAIEGVETENPSFAKLVAPIDVSVTNGLGLPETFVKVHLNPSDVPGYKHDIVLEDEEGNIFPGHWIYSHKGRNPRIREGWKQFVNQSNVKENDILIVEARASGSLLLKVLPQASERTETQIEAKKPTIFRESMLSSISCRDHEQQKQTQTKESFPPFVKQFPSSEEAVRLALNGLQTAVPSFAKQISLSEVVKQGLGMPYEFVKKHLTCSTIPNFNHEIHVEDCRGVKFPGSWRFVRKDFTNPRVYGGWMALAKAHSAGAGDVVLVEVPSDRLFKIRIFQPVDRLDTQPQLLRIEGSRKRKPSQELIVARPSSSANRKQYFPVSFAKTRAEKEWVRAAVMDSVTRFPSFATPVSGANVGKTGLRGLKPAFFREHLKLRNVPAEFRARVKLLDAEGKFYGMELRYDPREACFLFCGDGWAEFACDYGIASGSVLIVEVASFQLFRVIVREPSIEDS